MIFICPLDICAYKLKILNSFFFYSITYIKNYKKHTYTFTIFFFFFSFLFLFLSFFVTSTLQIIKKSTKQKNTLNNFYNYKISPKTIGNYRDSPLQLEQCQGSFLGREQCWDNGGALLHARTVTGLQNNRGSVAASPLLPLTGSENHCHLQKEKKHTRQ
jgi:hypothetical protein